MKKAVSILLLIVFLFNIGGYYLVFWGLRFQADQKLGYRLDANLYAPSETVELKIPVSLPYPIHPQGFQRVDGRFEHNGEFFRLVKQRHQNDTLYVVCIRDNDTRALMSTMKQFVTDTLGLTTTNEKAVNYLSKLIKDFFPQDDLSIPSGNEFGLAMTFFDRPVLFSSRVIPVVSPPPNI